MLMTAVLDVDQARVSRAADGSITFDDPRSPWLLRIWTQPGPAGRPVIGRLRVDTRPGGVPVTATRLGRLPTTQMLHIAATADAVADAHPNEVYFRMLSRPLAVGQRRWGPDHWQRVLTVYQWAIDTDRPGGPAKAVADMWGVTVDPTVYRWLAHARHHAEEAA